MGAPEFKLLTADVGINHSENQEKGTWKKGPNGKLAVTARGMSLYKTLVAESDARNDPDSVAEPSAVVPEAVARAKAAKAAKPRWH